MALTLVLGGARSGKSAWAEDLAGKRARERALPVLYVATARPLGWARHAMDGGRGGISPHPGAGGASAPTPFDPDFTRRIARHQQRRPQSWITEDHRDLVDILRTPPTGVGAVLVDDLGTWLTAQMDAAGFFEFDEAVDAEDATESSLTSAREEALRAQFAELEQALRQYTLHYGDPDAAGQSELSSEGARPVSSALPRRDTGEPPNTQSAAIPLIIVTPEVGMGVIPAHPAGRQFRDLLGELNEMVARYASRAVFVVAGCSLELTPPRPATHPQ